jgi:D-glycero-D-manno-heptose 1,7-bisphosphate phosphatase
VGHPAVFLDRDGVIIQNVDEYVRTWGDVTVLPQALAALRRLATMPLKTIVVTNQSAVGRGLVSQFTVDEINSRLLGLVEQAGGRIDGVYVCPHTPEMGCDCRKPAPGLLLKATAEHHIDLGHSVVIGDALSDMGAGRSAGVGRLILVRTGRGIVQEPLLHTQGLGEIERYDTLEAAVNAIGRPYETD